MKISFIQPIVNPIPSPSELERMVFGGIPLPMDILGVPILGLAAVNAASQPSAVKWFLKMERLQGLKRALIPGLEKHGDYNIEGALAMWKIAGYTAFQYFVFPFSIFPAFAVFSTLHTFRIQVAGRLAGRLAVSDVEAQKMVKELEAAGIDLKGEEIRDAIVFGAQHLIDPQTPWYRRFRLPNVDPAPLLDAFDRVYQSAILAPREEIKRQQKLQEALAAARSAVVSAMEVARENLSDQIIAQFEREAAEGADSLHTLRVLAEKVRAKNAGALYDKERQEAEWMEALQEWTRRMQILSSSKIKRKTLHALEERRAAILSEPDSPSRTEALRRLIMEVNGLIREHVGAREERRLATSPTSPHEYAEPSPLKEVTLLSALLQNLPKTLEAEQIVLATKGRVMLQNGMLEPLRELYAKRGHRGRFWELLRELVGGTFNGWNRLEEGESLYRETTIGPFRLRVRATAENYQIVSLVAAGE